MLIIIVVVIIVVVAIVDYVNPYRTVCTILHVRT